MGKDNGIQGWEERAKARLRVQDPGGWPAGLASPVAPNPPGARITCSPVQRTDGHRLVLVVLSNAGGAAYAYLTAEEAGTLAENLVKLARVARTGLMIVDPSDGAPGGGAVGG